MERIIPCYTADYWQNCYRPAQKKKTEKQSDVSFDELLHQEMEKLRNGNTESIGG